MLSFLKSTFKISVALGFFVLPMDAAIAQSAGFLPGGNISIGSNGPVANFNTGPVGNSVLGGNGSVRVSPQGSGFRFNANSIAGNRSVSGPIGNGSQGFQSSQNGSGFFGGGPSSNSGFFGGGRSGQGAGTGLPTQGDMGVVNRESIRTQGRWNGDSRRTDNRNGWKSFGENVTSTLGTAMDSVDMRNFPSATESLGFRGGAAGWATTILGRNGRRLPPTSTSSVDLNIVE